jgi:hypothetical protein
MWKNIYIKYKMAICVSSSWTTVRIAKVQMPRRLDLEKSIMASLSRIPFLSSSLLYYYTTMYTLLNTRWKRETNEAWDVCLCVCIDGWNDTLLQ